MFLLQIVLVTIVIPLIVLMILLSFKKIDSVMIAQNKQRRLPVFLIFLIIAAFVYTNEIINYSTFLIAFFYAIAVSAIISLLGTFTNFKVSLHQIGITILAVFNLALNIIYAKNEYFSILISIVLIGFIMSSRLHMKAHKPAELIAGFVLAIVVSTLSLSFFYKM